MEFEPVRGLACWPFQGAGSRVFDVLYGKGKI